MNDADATPDGARLVLDTAAGPCATVLQGPRATLGRTGADVVLDDPTVSRLHAVVAEVSGGWVLEDLGSRNGTYVNGRRVAGPVALRDGDVVRLGTCHAMFQAGPADPRATTTEPTHPAPVLTTRERDVVVALCRPLLSTTVLSEPASLAAIAAELVISESGVKKLLSRSFDKFGLVGADRRRSRLAVEALRSGAVTRADLERSTPTAQVGDPVGVDHR